MIYKTRARENLAIVEKQFRGLFAIMFSFYLFEPNHIHFGSDSWDNKGNVGYRRERPIFNLFLQGKHLSFSTGKTLVDLSKYEHPSLVLWSSCCNFKVSKDLKLTLFVLIWIKPGSRMFYILYITILIFTWRVSSGILWRNYLRLYFTLWL